MDGLCFPAEYCTPPQCIEYVGTAGGEKPAVHAAEQMGKSPPVVKEYAMKDIFRVNKRHELSLQVEHTTKLYLPSCFLFYWFLLFHIDLRRAIELLSELPGVFLNNSLGHVQQKHSY